MLPQNDRTVVCLVNAESLCSLLFFFKHRFAAQCWNQKRIHVVLFRISVLALRSRQRALQQSRRPMRKTSKRMAQEHQRKDMDKTSKRMAQDLESRTSQEHARRTSTQAARMQSSFKILTQGHLRKNLFDSTGRPQRTNKNTLTNIPYTKSSDTQLTP